MAHHPRSLRRNLLFKILAFSLPILIVGQLVALRKAKSSLLKTARQNLTSSAIRKAEGSWELAVQSIEASLNLIEKNACFSIGRRRANQANTV